VVTALLESVRPDEMSIQDRNGSTPLHVACWNGATATLIQSLLSVNKSAASIRNRFGRTPLHICLESYPFPSLGTVQMLVHAHPTAVAVMDNNGDTPLSLLCSRIKDTIDNAITKSEEGIETSVIYKTILKPFWPQVNLIIQTIEKGWCDYNVDGTTGKESKLLHSLASIPACPRLLSKLGLTLHPEQVREFKNGDLPLHIVARCPYHLRSTDLSLTDATYISDKDDVMVRDLLNEYPEACTFPDGSGQLPLHLAVEAGKAWETIIAIFHANPEAIGVPDAITGLLPFMVAAKKTELVHRHHVIYINPRDRQLQTIFELLQADPSIIDTHNMNSSQF
jgi:hypothetical protein